MAVGYSRDGDVGVKSGVEDGEDRLLEGSEGCGGAGAVAGVVAGDVVEFVEGLGDGAEGEGFPVLRGFPV